MEAFHELRDEAKRKLHLADHMLTQTYPLIKDPRLLLAIMENLFLALTNSMAALLHYEMALKQIPPFQDNFSSKFNVFREKCIGKYKIDNSYACLILDVKDILLQHKKSPIDFARKGSFVICSEDYRMRVISPDEIKRFVAKTKLFIQEVSNILSKGDDALGS